MLADRVRKVQPSLTMAVDAKAKQMKKEGIDVIGFGAGEPDFNTPDNIKEAGIKAIKENMTRYMPAAGSLELRAAVAEKFKRENGLEYKAENTVISVGAKHSLYVLFQAVLNPGDEVIIFSPYWVSYVEMVRLADAIPVISALDESRGFDVDFDDLKSKITSKTKAIVVNSPSNPTGAIFPDETLKKIAGLALEKNILIVSDEIYEKILYNGKTHTSIAALSPDAKKNTVVINGASKSYAMTGWRIGYAAADNMDIIKAMSKIQSHSTSNPTSIAQIAALESLKTPDKVVKDMVVEFDRRRKYMMERVKAFEGFSFVEPEGAFYLFPGFKGLIGKDVAGKNIKDSLGFADLILEKANVAVVPGIAFGSDESFRLSYATSMKNIEEGLNRIEKLIT